MLLFQSLRVQSICLSNNHQLICFENVIVLMWYTMRQRCLVELFTSLRNNFNPINISITLGNLHHSLMKITKVWLKHWIEVVPQTGEKFDCLNHQLGNIIHWAIPFDVCILHIYSRQHLCDCLVSHTLTGCGLQDYHRWLIVPCSGPWEPGNEATIDFYSWRLASFPGSPGMRINMYRLHNFNVCIPERGSLGTRLAKD